MSSRRIRRLFVLVLCASMLVAGRSAAQVQQGAASPIDDLLTKAQQAFNDLNYSRADTLARQVLGLGGRITQGQRMKALMVIAAAYYPEDQPSQKRAEATAALKQIVREDVDAKLPQELSWAGLDSLFADVKRNTFTMNACAEETQTATGPRGQGEIKVRSNRPASFHMSVAPAAGGSPVATDSALNVTTGSLHFATMRGDRPALSSGDYEITVAGTDAASGDTVTIHCAARVTSPELVFAKVPATIDSTRLQAERTPRYGNRGILVGGVLAVGIYGFSSLLRADTAVKRVAPADSKGLAVAAATWAAVVAASFEDRGRPIPGAIVANQKLRDDLAASIRSTEAENANRIATYTTTILLRAGAR